MPRKPDMPCSMCGTLMWRGKTSAAQPICRPCRTQLPKKSYERTGTCSHDGCERVVLGRGMCAPHYSYWHRAQKRYTITCVVCEKTVQVARANSKCCSRACASIMGVHASGKQLRSKELVLYTGPRLQQPPIVHVRTASRLTSGQCRTCGEWFVSRNLDVTCSLECFKTHRRDQKHANEHRRRARQKAAFVANVYRKKVFEADQYRCHLCGKKTDKTKKVPHPKAPTIDHVVPLNRGGTHEPANCRTACFSCNSSKRDRGGGEQLLLLAV